MSNDRLGWVNKTGHYHNNKILKVLFADRLNYEII